MNYQTELTEIGRIAAMKPQHFEPPLVGAPATMIVENAHVTVYVKFNNGQNLPVTGATIAGTLRAARRVAQQGP